MKRFAIACIIAVSLFGCVENPKNTNDEKSDMTSHSEDIQETSSEVVVTENTTSKLTDSKPETVSTTVSPEKSSDYKEFVVTEKIEENTETFTVANDDIFTNTTESTVTEITQESEKTTVSETKKDVIELPFVPVGRMMKYTYKIGGKIIEIDSIYDEVHKLCKDYKYCGDIDFSVKTSQPDIDFEREKSGRPIGEFADSYLETLAVYRKIAERMIEFNTILFHGSAIAVDGAGYLFTAKSGTGKSTHTRLWREYFGERAVMVNDDKPFLQITENGIFVYGTPWDGKHRLSSNISVPLKAICMLNRGVKNKICPLTKSEAYPMLLQQTHRPMNTEKMRSVFTLLDKMCKHLKLYRLECNMNPDAVTTAYNGMNMEELK